MTQHEVEPAPTSTALWCKIGQRRLRRATYFRAAAFVPYTILQLTASLAALAGVALAVVVLRMEPVPFDHDGCEATAQGLLECEYQELVTSRPILFMYVVGVAGTYAALSYVVAPLAAALILLLPALRWSPQQRLVLLRPFHNSETSGSLRRLWRSRIGGMGHTFTLSDPGIRRPVASRIPILVPYLWLLTYRRRVRSLRGLARFSRLSQARFRRNINWYMSWSKIFPVTASMGVWKPTVEHLLLNSHVIVIDVSEPKESLQYEVELCCRLAVQYQTLFICHIDRIADEATISTLRTFVGGQARVFTYGPKGFDNEDGFVNEVADLLSRSAAAPHPRMIG